MKRAVFFMAILVSLASTGCTGPAIMTADDYRQYIPNSFGGKCETYEVDRSTSDIGKTFNKYAPRCLTQRVEKISQTGTVGSHLIRSYTPTVVVDRDRVELHVQEKHELSRGYITAFNGPQPEDGYYIFVVDVTPIGKNKSKIDFYGPKETAHLGTMYPAIKNWIEGENLGCPDLTN